MGRARKRTRGAGSESNKYAKSHEIQKVQDSGQHEGQQGRSHNMQLDLLAWQAFNKLLDRNSTATQK